MGCFTSKNIKNKLLDLVLIDPAKNNMCDGRTFLLPNARAGSGSFTFLAQKEPNEMAHPVRFYDRCRWSNTKNL